MALMYPEADVPGSIASTGGDKDAAGRSAQQTVGGTDVQLCLFSVSYAGLWGQERLELPDFIRHAAKLGYRAVMLMGKRPHLSPLDMTPEKTHEMRQILAQTGVECAVVGAYTDFSGAGAAEVPFLETQIGYVEALARLAREFGAKVVRVFTAYEAPGIPFPTLWDRSLIRLKPGATVLALDDTGAVYLTEEFHYAVGRRTLEAVSGGCDPGETPLATAKRELREELGIEAASWLDLGSVDPFTTNVVSPTQLFLARHLQFGAKSPEGTEHIDCVKLSLSAAVAQVMDGRITHAPTCVALLKAQFFEERRSQTELTEFGNEENEES